MRIAFYAPLKAPTHATPSGDRRVARLYMAALERCGHEVVLASSFRSLDMTGDAVRQRSLRAEGLAQARALCADWSAGRPDRRPQLWFTYPLHHKAPDWLGPTVCRHLGIPYVIAEASHAPKRAGGAWSLGFDAAQGAIEAADLLLCPTRHDLACLQAVAAGPGRIEFLPPFLDAAPFRSLRDGRQAARARLAAGHGMDDTVPWIVVAAMMREGDKLASYRALADTLSRVLDLRWHVLIAGDGPARAQVEQACAAAIPGRARLFGALGQGELATLFQAGDLYLWPGVNEAYGMAALEAQAAGMPVVSSQSRGIPDVVVDGRTGLLAPAGDWQLLADQVRRLLLDGALRCAMGRKAADFVLRERSIDASCASLAGALARIPRR